MKMSKFTAISTSLYIGLLSIISCCYFYNQITASSAVILLLLASFLRFVFLPSDCDMTVLFYEHFGKKVDTLSGQVIWITGASTGIGKEMALAFSKGKVKLVLSATSEDKLHHVKEKCVETGNLDLMDVLILPFDMTDLEKHKWAFSAVMKRFGKLDILVSNAGRSQRASWENIEINVDKSLFDLNVFALVHLARLVTKHFMSVGRGKHVVMSSIAGKMGIPFSASYTASKHAVMGYFESLRAEQGAKGISITVLCPGPVESDLMKKVYREKTDEVGDKPRTGDMMSGERCAQLSVVAAANGISEAWMVIQPALTIFYLNQYFPAVFKWFVNNVDFGSIAARIRDGGKKASN